VILSDRRSPLKKRVFPLSVVSAFLKILSCLKIGSDWVGKPIIWVRKWYKKRARFLAAVVYIGRTKKNDETTDKEKTLLFVGV